MLTSTKRLPVIFSILDSPAYGGAEQYLLSNLRYLSQQGYPVCLATNNLKVKEQCELIISQFKLERFSIIRFPFVLDAIGNWKGLVKFFFWTPFAISWQVKTFLQLQKTHSHTICYWAGFSDRLLLSPVAKLFQIPLIWIEIGPLEPTFKKTWGFPKFLYQLTKNLPLHFITTSLWTKQSMISTGGINANKISLVYPGVVFPQESDVKNIKNVSEKWRRSEKLEDEFIVSFIGRMAKENEIDVLMHAIKILKNNFHLNIFTIIIGDGPDLSYYKSLASSLEIETQVFFTGFISQKKKLEYVASSDVFVFARAWDLDGFGMTPLEGMSVEVPVITTDFGPQKEIVEDYQNGLRFVPHDFHSLAEKIFELAQNKSLRMKLGKQGRISITPKFTEETMHKKSLKVIKQVIGG